MKPQDWFGLGVRFVGVWCMIQVVTNVLNFWEVKLGFTRIQNYNPLFMDNSPVGNLMYAAGYACLAAYFLLGVGHLTALTFGTPPPVRRLEEPDEESAE